MDIDQDHPFRHPQHPSSPQGSNPTPQENTPNGAQVTFPGQAEPRSSQACDNCRQRKVKCDQQQPCSSCTRSGKPSACTFSPPARRKSHKAAERRASPLINHMSNGNDSDVAPATDGASVWSSPYTAPQGGFRAINQPRTTTARSRGISINANEGLNGDELYHKPAHPRPALQSAVPQESAKSLTRAGIVSVKHQKSQYIPSWHPSVLLKRQIPELRQSVDRLVRETETRSKLSNIRNALPKPVKEELARGWGASVDKFIPEQEICDRLFETFFATWGSVFHILDRTNFQSSYHEFFQEFGQSGDDTMFRPKLALAAASVAGLDPAYHISSSERRQLCLQTEAWLDTLPRNHESSVDYLEVRCLLYLVHYSLSMDALDAWRTTGDMVRRAMGQGLHQNPELVQSLSPRQRQGRRRLWGTLLELDCQAALAAGMRPEVRPDELLPESLSTPTPGGSAAQTTAQAQQNKAYWHSLPDQLVESLTSRVALVNAIASGTVPNGLLDFREHSALPLAGSTSQDSRITLARVIIDLFYCRPRLVAYQTLAAQAEHSGNPVDPRIHTSCVELSLRIISHLEMFDADVTDLPSNEALLCWQFLAKVHFDLILQAAYSLCLELYRVDSFHSTAPSHSKATIIHTLNRIMTSFLEKDPDLSRHNKDLVCLALVIQYVRSNTSVERKEELMRQALDRVVEACKRRGGITHGMASGTSYGSSSNGLSPEPMPSNTFDWDMFDFDLDGGSAQHLPTQPNNFDGTDP